MEGGSPGMVEEEHILEQAVNWKIFILAASASCTTCQIAELAYQCCIIYYI